MAGRVGYFQCIGGVSGDMILGALVDCGLPIESLRSVVSALGIRGASVSAAHARRQGAFGTRVSVELDGDRRGSISDFVGMVRSSGLPADVVETSTEILLSLERAEARVHREEGRPVQLAELGSFDTVIDVACSVAGLAELGVEGVHSSPIPSGSGSVTTSHGQTPIPAPATMVLLAEAGAPIAAPPPAAAGSGEMVTPTGAAILTALATFQQPPMTLEIAGYGLGCRDPKEYPNALALWLGRRSASARDLVLLETNIDDGDPRLLGHTVDRLLSIGALDAWLTAAQMKKGRLGSVLSALVEQGLEDRAASLIMEETSTLGVRTSRVSRHEAARQQLMVETEFGRISVKIKRMGDRIASASPEFDVARRIALEKRVPLRLVLESATRAAVDALRDTSSPH